MDGVFAKASAVGLLLRLGRPKQVKDLVGRFWDTETRYIGLRRDLWVPFAAPAAKVGIAVRPLEARDIEPLMNARSAELPEDEQILRYWQRRIVKAEIPTCWVAVTDDGTPCYMQWLIGHADLGRAKAFYGQQFPDLRPDEALLEGAFTPIEFRGKGIMPCAMAMISDKAAELGARWVITFVADDNRPALKGCQRAGFAPHIVRFREWRRFRRRFSIEAISEESRIA
jgi:hypothetical protein